MASLSQAPAGSAVPLSRRLAIAVLAALIALGINAPTSGAASTTEAGVESAIVKLIAKERAARGLPAFGVDSKLVSIAGKRAATLADKQVLDHAAAGNLQNQLNAAGVAWKRWGENLAMTTTAWGPSVASALFALWKGSPSHWKLIVSRDFNRIGVGVSRASDGATYASIVFIWSPNGSGVAPPAPKATPKPTPRPAPEAPPPVATPAPTPEPRTADARLWDGDPAAARPSGDTNGLSPGALVAWFAGVVDRLAATIGQLLTWIASAGPGTARAP